MRALDLWTLLGIIETITLTLKQYKTHFVSKNYAFEVGGIKIDITPPAPPKESIVVKLVSDQRCVGVLQRPHSDKAAHLSQTEIENEELLQLDRNRNNQVNGGFSKNRQEFSRSRTLSYKHRFIYNNTVVVDDNKTVAGPKRLEQLCCQLETQFSMAYRKPLS